MDISVNALIITLLNKYLEKKYNQYRTFTRINYQKKEHNGEWTSLHLWLSPGFYEKCLDLRKLYKFSLSYIIAQSIELYLCKLLKGETDNYFQNYIFLSTESKKCSILIIAWEYPKEEKHELILKLLE